MLARRHNLRFKHARQRIYPEVQQTTQECLLLVVEVRHKGSGVYFNSSPLLKANHKGKPENPLRITGKYKHFGVPSQIKQLGQPRRTPSRLGFQEPKSNKHKSSQLGGEANAQDVNRSLSLSNLTSLLKSCQGFGLGAKGRKRGGVSVLGSRFSEQRSS